MKQMGYYDDYDSFKILERKIRVADNKAMTH